MTYLTLLAGLVLLVAGGDLLVRGAVAIALRFGISTLIIGLTLVGFGTSTPELVTSLDAAIREAPGIAVGNVVGSNTANILLILGLSALITPIAVAPQVLKRDGTVVVLAAVACLAVVLSGDMGRLYGGVLVALLALYVYSTYRLDSGPAARSTVAAAQAGQSLPVPGPTPVRLTVSLLLFAAGLALTIVGAGLLVSAAISLARSWQVSEAVIGVTIVAIGTSLPELVTSVMAAIRRQADIAFGNIIGSNIFNILGILGVTGLVHPIVVPAEIARVDIWVMLAATVLLLGCSATGWRLSRMEGGLFVLSYAAYLGWLIAG